jgi:hypothetical protein
MSDLFQSLDSPRSALAAAIIVEALCDDDYARVRSLCQSIEPGAPRGPLGDVKPDVMAFLSPSFVIVILSGTENWSQGIDNVIKSSQQPHPPLPGEQHVGFYEQAKAVHDALDDAVAELLPTRTLVIMGHSRGAAVGQILATWWGPHAKEVRCYLFGSPRAGDPVFGDALDGKVVRYENALDSVVILPFGPVDNRNAPWYERWFGPNVLAVVWADVGDQRTLSFDGTIKANGDRATSSDFYDQLVNARFGPHQMHEYKRRLQLNQPDPFTLAEVADPPQFNEEKVYLAAADADMGPIKTGGSAMPTPLASGTYFFKTLDRTFGWTESWYASMAPAAMISAMQSALTFRLKFLSPDCCIYWIRGAVVDIGAPRQAVLQKYTQPKKGTARPGGSVATDYPNSTMDCIVATLFSNQGSKRQEKFRGLPDMWLEDDSLSDSGWTALDLIDSYLRQVKAAGLGIRRQTMLPTDKMAIKGISKNDDGNITINVPGHGILETQPFRGLIRGRDLANPMLRAAWNLSVTDANTLELISSTRFGEGSGVAGGTVTVAEYGGDSLVNPPAQTRLFDFNQTSTIKTGRPSDLHHGKKSAVLRHR